MISRITLVFIFLFLGNCTSLDAFKSILNAPDDHVPYILSHHRSLLDLCISEDKTVCEALLENRTRYCWGYEDDCDRKFSYSSGWPRNCASPGYKDDFWRRADFGFVTKIQQEMKSLEICSPEHPDDSSLICSRNMRYCIAKNLYIDLRRYEPKKDRFNDHMFQQGMIGGHCLLRKRKLDEQNEHPYPLQSWYSELQNYTSLAFRPSRHKQHCDVTVETPTIFMKLDSGINLYHHFCDFFNLYLSQHVNNTWFSTDNQIVMWDTSSMGYFDMFSDAWVAFSAKPVNKLLDWSGKRICVREAMFPLLPRMRGGLYYNTYIPPGCVGSSLFRAFSKHFLHRMGVAQDKPSDKIRLTLLERGKPEDDRIFRKIKNQDELLKVIAEFPEFEVKVVEYNWREMTFKEQLQTTHNSDIFIGMHGAGLLHFLFLPDWAVALELYNCGDEKCYHDLARLRGIDYLTWQNGEIKSYDRGKHQRYGENPKFWNWSFDPAEFRVLIKRARDLLLRNPKFLARKPSKGGEEKVHSSGVMNDEL